MSHTVCLVGQGATIILMWLPSLAAGAEDIQTGKARDLYEQAHKYERAKQYDRAIAYLTAAIEVNPRFAPAYFGRSALHADRKDYVSAVSDLTELLKLEPRNYSARFNRALYLEILRKWDAAIADYSLAVAPDTDYSRHGSSKEECMAHAFHYRGRVYQWHKKDYERAVADYTEALRLDPSIRMVHYRRGQAYHALRKYGPADQDFATAYERRPDYPNLLHAWVWQLATCPEAEFRNGAKAVAIAEAYARGGNRHLAPDTLAAAYAEAGRYGEAVQWQRKALERTRDNIELRRRRQERLKLYESRRPYREP